MSNEWDREDNTVVTSEDNIVTFTPSGPVRYMCHLHGETDQTIQITVRENTSTYCTECLKNRLDELFPSLERVEDE